MAEPIRRPDHVSCLTDEPGARRTRCGKRSSDVATTWARWAQAHIEGRDAQYCPACTDGLNLAAIDFRLLDDDERRKVVGW